MAPDSFSLANGWNAVEGGLLGYGACSQAQLTSAEVVTQVAASTCAGDTTATSPTCAPPTLQPNASASVGSIGTVETNNLTPIGSPSVGYPNTDLAVTSMTATTSGGCLGPSHAYVKDSVNDFGATPRPWESGLLGEPGHFPRSPWSAGRPQFDLDRDDDYPGRPVRHLCKGAQRSWLFGREQREGACLSRRPRALSVQWGPVTKGQYVGDNGGRPAFRAGGRRGADRAPDLHRAHQRHR